MYSFIVIRLEKKTFTDAGTVRQVIKRRLSEGRLWVNAVVYQHEPRLSARLWAEYNSNRRIRRRAVQDDGLSAALGQFPAQTVDGRFYSVESDSSNESGYSTKFSFDLQVVDVSVKRSQIWFAINLVS